jgi:hypothetical protein
MYAIKKRIDATEPVFTKLRLARRLFVKYVRTKFNENRTSGFVTDTGSQADEWLDLVST